MNDIITKVQALQTADDAALLEIVTALQALPPTPVQAIAVSVTINFNDGSTQTVPVATV